MYVRSFLITETKWLRKQLKDGRFILVHGFSGFSPLSLASLFLGHSEVEHYNMTMWRRRATYPTAARKHKERPREQEGMIDKTNTSRTPLK